MKHVQYNRCEEERYVQVYTASYSHDLESKFVQNDLVFFLRVQKSVLKENRCVSLLIRLYEA